MLTKRTYSYRNDHGQCGDQGHGAERWQLRTGGDGGNREAALGDERVQGKASVVTSLDHEHVGRKMEPLGRTGENDGTRMQFQLRFDELLSTIWVLVESA